MGAAMLALGWLLSRATVRVANWFVMTDELYYERLAISIAQTGSLLPRIHGELVANVNQLYPALLSLVYDRGDVPASLADAHVLNAFVITSAAVPVYLLARRAGAGGVLALLAGLTAAAVPWVVLASFLLTEVVAYPAFCWAVLALCVAVERRVAALDLLALAAVTLAVLARTQFLVLLLVFAAAVVWDAAVTGTLREVPRSRTVLVGAYAVLALGGLGLLAAGQASRVLGSYAVAAGGLRVDFELLRLAAAHTAVLALGLAILPFLLGCGWLLDRLRASAPPHERAVAAVGTAALALVILEVASFDQRFGAGQVKDRYLFYVVPVVLVAVAAAVAGGRFPPPWAVAAPAAVCVAGFAWLPLPRYVKLNVDSPLAILNDELVRLATSAGWARAALVLATVVGAAALVEAAAFFPRRAVLAGIGALAAVALPGSAVYAFDRLFAVDGTNGLPVTLDQGSVFGWVDRALGAEGRVTFARYPVESPDYWAGVAYWWDVEFWNERVVREAEVGFGSRRPDAWTAAFDAATGVYRGDATTAHALQHASDARFGLAGDVVARERGAVLIATGRPWRAAWLADGIHPDGWTRPHTPARLRVFPQPGARTPVTRFLTISVDSPDEVDSRPVTIGSALERHALAVPPNEAVDQAVAVCVPPDAPGIVEIETPIVSAVYRDPTLAPLTGEVDRPAGVRIRSVALADETVPVERCPAEGTDG